MTHMSHRNKNKLHTAERHNHTTQTVALVILQVCIKNTTVTNSQPRHLETQALPFFLTIRSELILYTQDAYYITSLTYNAGREKQKHCT